MNSIKIDMYVKQRIKRKNDKNQRFEKKEKK